MKYISCPQLEHGITFYSNSVMICCISSHAGGGNICQIDNYKGELIDWDKFFEKRRQLRANSTNGIPDKCEGCYYLKEQEWPEGDYIDEVLIGHWTYCNCNCTYCYTNSDKKFFNSLRTYNIMPVIRDMAEKNILSKDALITFGGGEPTILTEFEELMDFLSDYGIKRFRIHSSGIKYSKSIERCLEEGKLALIVSVDSGSKEIYEKVKCVPCFDKVWENLREYAKHNKGSLIRTKYVLMPYVNDSWTQIKNWLNMTQEAGIKDIAFDIEDNWFKANREQVPESVYEMLDFVYNHYGEFGMNSCELYERASNYRISHDENK